MKEFILSKLWEPIWKLVMRTLRFLYRKVKEKRGYEPCRRWSFRLYADERFAFYNLLPDEPRRVLYLAALTPSRLIKLTAAMTSATSRTFYCEVGKRDRIGFKRIELGSGDWDALNEALDKAVELKFASLDGNDADDEEDRILTYKLSFRFVLPLLDESIANEQVDSRTLETFESQFESMSSLSIGILSRAFADMSELAMWRRGDHWELEIGGELYKPFIRSFDAIEVAMDFLVFRGFLETMTNDERKKSFCLSKKAIDLMKQRNGID